MIIWKNCKIFPSSSDLERVTSVLEFEGFLQLMFSQLSFRESSNGVLSQPISSSDLQLIPKKRRVKFEIMSYIHGTSQAQSHMTTDSQLVSQSWCHAPTGAQDQIFVSVRQRFVDVVCPLCWEDGYGSSVYALWIKLLTLLFTLLIMIWPERDFTSLPCHSHLCVSF